MMISFLRMGRNDTFDTAMGTMNHSINRIIPSFVEKKPQLNLDSSLELRYGALKCNNTDT